MGNAASTLLQTIIAGIMGIKLATPTQAYRVNSRSQVTYGRLPERTTWAEVRPTRNDIQGRQLYIINQYLNPFEPQHLLNHIKQQSWTLDALATFF
jgi:hypothetical protein